MKLDHLYLEQNPDAHLVLHRFDLEKEKHTSYHYVWNDGIEYCFGMDILEWMVWPNREVAEFAAKLFTRLYQSVEPENKDVSYTVGHSQDCVTGLYNPRALKMNWFGAFMVVLAGYDFQNEKIIKIHHVKSRIFYWTNRVLWGTNGK